MAEHFSRGETRVSFSNGALETLYRALVILGERNGVERTPAGVAVLAHLRRELEHGPVGGRAFVLEPVEDDLADGERLRVLAYLLAELAHALTVTHPDPTLTKLDWDRELRLSWLSRVEILHEMVADTLEPDGGCAPLLLDLDPSTAAEVDAERLLHAYRRVKNRGVPGETIAHIDRTIALLEHADALQRRAAAVFSLMSDKADLLVKSGDRKQAAKVLCDSTEFTHDTALAQATMDYAADLEGRDR